LWVWGEVLVGGVYWCCSEGGWVVDGEMNGVGGLHVLCRCLE